MSDIITTITPSAQINVEIIGTGPKGDKPVKGVDYFTQDDINYIISLIVQDKHYRHVQDNPSNTWTIVHNLDKYPSVSIIDSGNNLVMGDIKYISLNELVISFNGGFSGTAYLN